jgi:hypothetical protein
LGYPYETLTNEEVARGIVNLTLSLQRPSVYSYPDELWEVALKCWIVTPHDRPTFQQLSKELTVILDSIKKKPNSM